MIEIKTADTDSSDYQAFQTWTLEEWGESENPQPVQTEEHSGKVPSPLLAYENNLLAGGLSFINYKNPEQKGDTLWINTVYVKEKYRGRKIAQTLIQTALQICQESGFESVYVYTDKPELYRISRWTKLEFDAGHFIMKYEFANGYSD